MKPRLYVDRLAETLEHVGWLDGNPPYWDTHSNVSQVETVGDWCASRWDYPPDDLLWWTRGTKETLFTYVMRENLNFQNTPFEHRYNLRISRPQTDLKILAKLEFDLWGAEYEAFVPFKNPHPQGYQGVWGDFNFWSEMAYRRLDVHDTFEPDHILKLGWWV